MSDALTILQGHCLETLAALPPECVQTCVTSPPYWGLRSYLPTGHPLKPFEIGTEKTPEEFVAKLVAVFAQVRRVLKDDGTLWLNLGDSYNSPGPSNHGKSKMVHRGTDSTAWKQPSTSRAESLKPKDLVGIPWRVAFALQADGWYLRSDIIWSKPNPMPESVTDRPTKAHEYIFLLTKSAKYFYDHEAVKEPLAESTKNDSRLTDPNYETGRPERGFPGQASRGSGLLKPKMTHKTSELTKQGNRTTGGLHDGREMRDFINTETALRNRRTVWEVATNPYSGAHFATFPPALIKPCILAGTKPGDTVLDPFGGSGTTGEVSIELGRKAILCELNPEYLPLIERRCDITPGFKL